MMSMHPLENHRRTISYKQARALTDDQIDFDAPQTVYQATEGYDAEDPRMTEAERWNEQCDQQAIKEEQRLVDENAFWSGSHRGKSDTCRLRIALTPIR